MAASIGLTYYMTFNWIRLCFCLV